MPVVRSTPAIVLRSWPYGESDEIVSFLTRDFGKLKGLAKGAKRSRRRSLNALEPFALVILRFRTRPNSSLVFVDGCDWTHAFRAITKELKKIVHASYLVEITDEFTKEGDECRALFELLYRGLRFLEKNDTSPTFLTAFEMGLLRFSGYEPMLAACRRCGARPPEPGAASNAVEYWGFSHSDGGVLCRACSRYSKDTVPVSLAALRVLAYFRDREWTEGTPMEFPTRAIEETRQLLPLFIQFQISKRLKSVAFLKATF